MNWRNFVSIFVRVNLITLLYTASVWAGTVYDLTTDWSDTTNPNGVWSVNSGSVPLQPVADLSDTGIDYFPTPQPGFTAQPIFGDIVPVWFRTTGPLDNGNPDWEIGDIITHTSRFDVPNSNVTWTSDFDGAIDILGSVWPTRGGINDWFLYHNEVLLTGGTVAGGDPFDRSNPFYFELGSGGLGVLRDIPVIFGDVVKLELVRQGPGSEDYVGVNLNIVGTNIVGKPIISCVGFEPPMANYPVTVKKNRALPLKAELFDAEGSPVFGSDLIAPPILKVWQAPEADDVSDDALPAGQGTEGNQFVFTDDFKWQFNLKTSNYSGPGTYTVIMESGDSSEYVIDPTCVTEFVVK